MSEEFRIDCSLRNSSTVYGKIFIALTTAALVDDPRNILFSDTALSRNENRNIGRSNGNSNFQRPVEHRIITDYIVFVFKTL